MWVHNRGVLNVGLTGGIGAGKSAVSTRLTQHGGVLIDSDVLAREVVEAGTEGLARIVETFGPSILAGDGGLDRARLAQRVFKDEAARADLEAIIHPQVRARSQKLADAAGPEAIVINDVPLLAEVGLAPSFDLVIVVTAPQDLRLERLEARGLPRDQALGRIAAQAPDELRAAVADVIVDNSGAKREMHSTVDSLWNRRLVPFEANKRAHRLVDRRSEIGDYDPKWPERYERLAARLRYILGDRAQSIDHIGSTAVAGLPGEDVIDVQVSVADLAIADGFAEELADAGFPRGPGNRSDPGEPFAAEGEDSERRVHGGTDPANLVRIHARVTGSPGWRHALAWRDYLRRHSATRSEYAALKRRLSVETASGRSWCDQVWSQVADWITETGWKAPLPRP